MCIAVLEEAIAKHGSDNVKVYKSDFLPMYYQMVEHKSRMKMKLVTAGPDEKVPAITQYLASCDPVTRL